MNSSSAPTFFVDSDADTKRDRGRRVTELGLERRASRSIVVEKRATIEIDSECVRKEQ